MTVGLLSFATNLFLSPLLSQRNVINLGNTTDYDYAWINHLTPGDSFVAPNGSAFSATTHTFGQLIDQNGWPNAAEASGQSFGGGLRLPASSNFAGPWVLTWDGDCRGNIDTGTWTEASTTSTAVGNANGTTTLSGFSSVIGIAPSFGISGTGVPGSTTVVSVNYATKTVVVSAAVTTGSGITFTFTNGTYTKNQNGRWTNVAGVKPYIVINSSGFSSPTLAGFQFQTTGSTAIPVSSMSWSGGLVTVTTTSPHGRPLGYTLSLTFFGATPSSINSTFPCTVTGASTYTFPLANNPGSITGTLTYIAFATNAALYHQVDEVDFMPTSVGGNGYVFRAPFKQMFVNLNPGAIRFLNWMGGNNIPECRFENHSLPTKAGLASNATAGPAYGVTSGVNQYTLAAATGTAGNPLTTPASMVHGEVAYCRAGSSMVRASSTPTAITKANPGNVTTSGAHGYSNGDLVIFRTADAANVFVGMVELNYVVITVANATTTTFDIHDINGTAIDTTGFTTFVASGNDSNSIIYPYLSLQVGSGNDRTAYPIVSTFGQNTPAGTSSTAVTAGSYYTFYFDKNLPSMRTAGAGSTWTYGVWIQGSGAPNGGVPFEHIGALIAEINILSKSQGINNPVHLWLPVPPRALLPVDPDYSTQSDWVLNGLNSIFNGSANCLGIKNTGASVIIEWSNEIWNFGTQTSGYSNWLSFLRGSVNLASFEPLQSLRAAVMMRNVRANSSFSNRVFGTLGFQGFDGYSGGNQNDIVASGSGIYFTDPWNTWGSATPLSFHDACNYASYFDPSGTYTNTTTGTGTFTDDSAMYNGTDNSGNGGGNYTGAANPTQAITNFVANITSGGAGAQSINTYCQHGNASAGLVGQFNTAMVAKGNKRVLGYEGGTDWPTVVGGGLGSHSITANDSLFLIAVNQSSQWGTAQTQYFSDCATLSNTGPQAIYQFMQQGGAATDFRWGYFGPDTYSGGVEGAAFSGSPTLSALGTRNQALGA